MRLTIKTLDERELSSIMTPCDARSEWIIETIEREFECREEDIDYVEDEELGDVISVHGKPVARVVSYAGWGAL